jgi:predicted amidohydrolase YtcJ
MSAPPFVLTGRIATVSGAADAQAILVRDGAITEVGDRGVAERAAAAGIAVRDMGSRLVVPGFVDPHVHLHHLAVGSGRGVDCRFPHCLTLAEVFEALRDGLAKLGDGEWLIGYGNLFFDQKIAERRTPTRAELDAVTSTVPIVLHLGGHTSVLNTPALELADVGRFMSGAAGGWGSPVVDLDSTGQPTGLVSEIDPFLPIPEADADSVEEYVASTYRRLFTTTGVTAFGEMVETDLTVETLDRLITKGRLSARGVMYAMSPAYAPLHPAVEWVDGYRSTAGPQNLRAAGVKMFADGGYSARNAATNTPYVREHAPHSNYRGKLNLTQGAVRQAIHATRRAEVQLAIHTNGTRAQREVLDAVLGSGNPLDHPSVRVEHLGNVLDRVEDIADWRATGVTPVLQPAFLNNFVGDFVPMLLGDAGTTGRLPLRTIFEEGVTPVASSDVGLGAEDDQSNPMFGIWCCMARRSYWNREIEPEERIGFAEALRLFTLEGARALGMADTIGSLEVGKQADIAVLNRDPRGDLDQVRTTKVDAVYLAGEQIHQRN